MERGEKRRLLLWSAGSFLSGLVAGGFIATKLFSPSLPPATLPLSVLLAEAHRFLDQGKTAEAERAYQSILARDPGYPEALTHLGNIAFQRGDVAGALSYYDEALRRDPSYAHALWDKGVALRAKGELAGAIAAWESFARLFPPDSPDVITVKQWIAEAKNPPGSSKPVSLAPTETLKELSRQSTKNLVKDKAAR